MAFHGISFSTGTEHPAIIIHRAVCVYIIVAMVYVLALFKETSQHHHLERLKPSYIFSTFKQLLTSRIFIGTTLAVLLSYGAFFAWFAAAPVLLIKVIGMSPVTFGWVTFLAGVGSYTLAGLINGRCVKKVGMAMMLRLGWSTMIFGGFLMLISKEFIGVNATAIMIPTFVFFLGGAFVWPNAFSTAMRPFGHIAGYAGPLYSFMQITGGAIIGGLVAYLPETDQLPLAFLMIGVPVVGWMLYELIVKRESK